MKHKGKARKAGFKLILITLIAVLLIFGLGALTAAMMAVVAATAAAVAPFLLVLWLVFAMFTLYFFRDPTANVPVGQGLVVSPGHGKIDVLETITEPRFMEGECQRISMFLSVIDVHVQNAPVGGKVAFFKYTEGQFLNALKAESAVHNENVYLGFEASDPPGQKIGVRVIAGVLARRIVPYVEQGDEVARGDRIGLVQFGSRADIYVPKSAKVKVKLGDHVTGGETVIAVFE